MNTTHPTILQQNLGDAVDDLRNRLRVKRGTDYCYTLKYGVIHVMCQQVYLESIKEVFENHDLVATYLTYPGD